MSEIVPFGRADDLYGKLLSTLDDLARFGIHVHSSNPNFICVCGVRFSETWCEGYGYDNLCPSCSSAIGPAHVFRNRIYTNRTVYVSDPFTYEDKKAEYYEGYQRQQIFRSRLYGLVVIDQQLHLICARVNNVGDRGWNGFDTCTLLDINSGNVVEESALHLSYWKLDELRQTQAPL